MKSPWLYRFEKFKSKSQHIDVVYSSEYQINYYYSVVKKNLKTQKTPN